MPTYGVLGVGSLGRAVVTGWCRQASPPPVVLSPRGAETAHDLARAYDTVRVAAANQEVVDRSDVVLVCLRRADAEVLGELRWRTDQVVVSAIAGLPQDELTRLVAPVSTVARAVPMVAVADHRWATPVHPPETAVLSMFEGVGGALPIDSAEAFDAIFTGTGTIAAFFEYLGVIEEFLVGHGLEADAARLIVAGAFDQALPDLEPGVVPDFAALRRHHATPGGGNEQFASLLRRARVPDTTREALEAIFARQRGEAPDQ